MKTKIDPCPYCKAPLFLEEFRATYWKQNTKIVSCPRCGNEIKIKRNNHVTDQQKLTEILDCFDDELYPEENALRKKTLLSGGRRWSFNNEGELVKVQEIVGVDSEGRNKYVIIGESVRTE